MSPLTDPIPEQIAADERLLAGWRDALDFLAPLGCREVIGCTVCARDLAALDSPPAVPVGRCAETGAPVFACTTCCG